MKVSFEQSGGVAGLSRGCAVDAESLGPAARDALTHLVQGTIGTVPGPVSRARDVIQYTLTVEDGGTTQTIAMPAGGVPPALHPLVQELKGKAQPIPPH